MYGGVNIDDQTRALRRGVDFFVGTCGRVLDHIERGNIDFSALKTVVLDEADQMLKQGFKEEVDKVSDFLQIIHISEKAKLYVCILITCTLTLIDPR